MHFHSQKQNTMGIFLRLIGKEVNQEEKADQKANIQQTRNYIKKNKLDRFLFFK
jgi:hypothetical protein